MQGQHEEAYVNLGKRIAYYRNKRNLSQEEFSKRLGCSLDDVKAIENEYPANIDQTTGVWVVKDLDFLFTIADILAVDVPAFFFPMTEEIFAKYRQDKI